jgi:hypothetical protein
MRSLPSSAERRILEFKCRLVISLHEERGQFWEAVRAIRDRWGVTAPSQLPPGTTSPRYLPDHPAFARIKRFDFRDKEEYDAWLDSEDSNEYHVNEVRWLNDINALHDKVIPEDYCVGGSHGLSLMMWRKFLSGCVVYDPPVPGLVKFRDRLRFGEMGGPPPPGRGPHYYMSVPPLAQVRDAEKAEVAQEEFYRRVIRELLERYIEPQGLNPGEVIRDVLRNTPGLWERLHEAEEQNPSRFVIDPKPYHTESDVRNAFQMIAAAREEPPRVGRGFRDALLAAECAILHDQCGWTYERLRDHYNWLDHSLVGKYIKTGRVVLGNL